MPELPEVESVRAQLEILVDATIVDGWDDATPRVIGAGSARGRVATPQRRGKWLILPLLAITPHELVVHLGMTGQLVLTSAPLESPHLHAWWQLSDLPVRRFLNFVDARRFGRCTLVEQGDYSKLPGLSGIGPDALDATIVQASLEAISSTNKTVKSVLLDQSVVAGVGNIYCDEALFAARIHPARRLSTLSSAELGRVCRAVSKTLKAGIESGGTTLRDYRRPDGSTGSHQTELLCYARSGLPCVRCSTLLVRGVVAGRTSTWCPACQAA